MKTMFFGIMLIVLISGCTVQNQENNSNNIVNQNFREHESVYVLCDSLEEAKKDSCYFDKAFERISVESGVKLCDEILNEGLQNLCYYNFATSLNDFKLCDKVTNIGLGGDYEEQHEKCINKIAINTGNVSDCEKISNLDKRESCYAKNVSLVEHLQICEKISHEISKNNCINNIALIQNDDTICKPITIDYILKDCYTRLLKCDKIEDDAGRSYCLNKAAQKNNDKTQCNNIPNETFRNECNRYFS